MKFKPKHKVSEKTPKQEQQSQNKAKLNEKAYEHFIKNDQYSNPNTMQQRVGIPEIENFGVGQNRETAYMIGHPVNMSGHQESNASNQRQIYSHIAHNSIGGVAGQDNNKLLASQMYNRASPGPIPTYQDQQRYLINMAPNHYHNKETMQLYQQDKIINPQVGFPQMHPAQIVTSPNQQMMMQKNMNIFQMGGYPIAQPNMQQMSLGMQYEVSNPLTQSYQLEGYVNQINGMRSSDQQKSQQPQQKSYIPQQKQLQV